MEPVSSRNSLDSYLTYAPSTSWTYSSCITPLGCSQWSLGGTYKEHKQQHAKQTSSQQQHLYTGTWEPPCALRGDATMDRFQLPKAGFAVNESGAVTMLLESRSMRRIIRPAWEAARAVGITEQQGKEQLQQRQRHAAAAQFEQQMQQRRAQAEAQEQQRRANLLAGVLHQLPEYMTSNDNPLADCLSYKSKLGSSSCTPHTAASIAPKSASSCNSSSSCCKDRYGRMQPAGPDAAAARAQQALRGQLAVGSLVPENGTSKELLLQQNQQQQQSSVVMAAAEDEYEEALRWKEGIMELFPHGAPKLVVTAARAQGVMLPGLGYASQLPPVRLSFNKRW